MFQWSKKVVKSVTFNPGVADESLLALVESQLEKDPEKTFSDLCKEALWQSLCVPESVRPTPKPVATDPPTLTPAPTTVPSAPTAISAATPPGVETQIAEMQSQIADLEERFFAKESYRLETMERHLTQLSQQVAQLAIMMNQVSTVQPLTQAQAVPTVEVVNHTPLPTNAAVPPPPLEEVDPVISRLSQFLDDF
ncbi:plasmid segregation centromere-binding protein ParR [Scytonema sp. UIC 10036]|uniref:plasmid segregation centromere-binding protein ParR n=1 Tax=Scytonema sp. UIC 10036 TaxID=2304196 RepID=UPI0012DAF03E|nr:plasmid segregation centromere-binding protein ParR [Scytonema sp. UIC 10036]MUG99964.1 plasmid segregation centromere-binding protein ParR [Scytonema sp. UIC 10036]